MKYSEIKQIVKTLRTNGWFKYKGIEHYRKVWSRGDYHCMYQVSAKELVAHPLQVEEILYHYERQAEIQLLNAPRHIY